MKPHKISTHMLLGVQWLWFTIGYRRQWRKLPLYAHRNHVEQSAYAGIGPLYFRVRLFVGAL